MLEVLIYLGNMKSGRKELTQYFSQQTELIKEIRQQLTEHLEQRFTIEELSKQYLINTSTLKEVFKAVYGLPISTYMKEYRVHQAMKLLRETDATIADIAAQVGYETQGKFSKAFKDVTQVLPTEYRKMQYLKIISEWLCIATTLSILFYAIRPFSSLRIVVLVEGEYEGRVTIASTASEYPLANFLFKGDPCP